MSALSILAAAAAVQAVAQTGAPPTPTVTDTSASKRVSGGSTYLDIEGGVGYSTNPLLELGSGTGRAFGRISLHAVHSRVTERTTTVLSAYAQNVAYFGRYGSQQSLLIDASHEAAINEHVRLFADASGGFDKGGQLDTRIIGAPVVPPLSGSVGLPPVLLPSSGDFLSITGRTYRVAAHAGGSFALSPHDELTISSGAEHVAFRGAGRSDYTTIPVSVAFDRVLSPRTTVGARVAYEDTNYDGPEHFQVITPQVTARMLLSERLTFDGAIGASFARINSGVATEHSTGLSAQGNLCWRGEASSVCARASTNEQTATVAGPARAVTASLDYSRRLDAVSTINLSAGLDRYSSPISVIAGRSFSDSTYYRAAADYSRRIGNRLYGGVNVAARKLTATGPDPKADLNASLFIRYRFGDIQ